MGACFLATGVLRCRAPLFTPVLWRRFLAGLGFGGLHVVFGADDCEEIWWLEVARS